MDKANKQRVIATLAERFRQANIFYLTDTSHLTVAQVNQLRRLCHKQGVQLTVAKNTLIRKALEAVGRPWGGLIDVLHGPTSIMFSEGPNQPAKVIKEFRKNHDRPILKAAYVDESVFIGDHCLDQLIQLKSRQELVSEVIGLLQSPMRRLVAALCSGGHRLAGIVQALEEKKSTQ